MSAQHPAGPVDPVTPLDGNVLAGRLGALFAVEVTTLVVVCGACGASGALAEAVVELDDEAAIVRCRACTHTLFTVLGDAGAAPRIHREHRRTGAEAVNQRGTSPRQAPVSAP